MSFASLPREAAWQHRGVRSGFEVVFFRDRDDGCLIRGCTTAMEDGSPWAVEQTYLRIPGEAAHQWYDYTAPGFDFRCRLTYDQSGLVLEYPGIAVRAA